MSDTQDADWLKAAYRDMYVPVAAYVRRRTPEPLSKAEKTAAKNLVSRILARACEQRFLTDPSTSSPQERQPGPWMFGIAAAELAREDLHEEEHDKRKEESFRPLPPEDYVEDEAVSNSLAALADDEREVLLLSLWEGLTVEEIAQAVQGSVEATHHLLHRARRVYVASLVSHRCSTSPIPSGRPAITDSLEISYPAVNVSEKELVTPSQTGDSGMINVHPLTAVEAAYTQLSEANPCPPSSDTLSDLQEEQEATPAPLGYAYSAGENLPTETDSVVDIENTPSDPIVPELVDMVEDPVLEPEEPPILYVPVAESPEVSRILQDESAAHDATESQHIVISMAAKRERREEERRKRAPFIGGIVLSIIVVAALVGWGIASPQKTISRDTAHTILRNAGATLLKKIPDPSTLPPGTQLVSYRKSVRHLHHQGVGYTVTRQEKILIDAGVLPTTQEHIKKEQLNVQIVMDKPGRKRLIPTSTAGDASVEIGTVTLPLPIVQQLPTTPNALIGALGRWVPMVEAHRSALVLLTVPGLSVSLYHALYQVVARAPGSRVISTPYSVRGRVPIGSTSIEFPATSQSRHTASITFDQSTGHVFAVTRATEQDKLLLVQGAGYVPCADMEGPHGPSDVPLACGTSGIVVRHVKWEGWGRDIAHGVGVATINDCEPTCSEGTKHNFDVHLTVNNAVSCGYGVSLYTDIEVDFPDKKGAVTPPLVRQHFPCPLSVSQ